MPGLYKGFSSENFIKNKEFEIFDVDVVKKDILNHIYTRKGERVMMPNFGTIIPEMVFEPLDVNTLEVLEDEVRTVINYDPRVRLIQLGINPLYERNTVIVSARLFYVELNMEDTLYLNIEFHE